MNSRRHRTDTTVLSSDAPRATWKSRALAVAAVATMLLVRFPSAIALPAVGSEESTEEALMRSAVDTLYTRGDPRTAAAEFREILRRNPNHYGATFQLAAALTAAGDRTAARPAWAEAVEKAAAIGDQKTARLAWERLASLAIGADDTVMQEGLDALYIRRDPNTAVLRFYAVLEHNPAHYGATYQLAAALDAAGRPEEAHTIWSKVLAMAEGYHDTSTATAVLSRLQKVP